MITKEQAYVGVLGTGVDLERRTLYLMGEVTSDSAYRFLPAIKMLDEIEGEIKVMMNSPGGEESSGYAIFDAIMACKNKVVIEGYGQVSSIAAIIFQAGDDRHISAGCEYMIHNGSIAMGSEESGGGVKQDQILDLAASITRGNKRYYSILVDNSSYGLDEIQQLCKEETYFNAKEAVDSGLADLIIPYVKKRKRTIKKRKKK